MGANDQYCMESNLNVLATILATFGRCEYTTIVEGNLMLSTPITGVRQQYWFCYMIPGHTGRINEE